MDLSFLDMHADMNPHMWFTIAVIVIAMGIYTRDKLPLEVTSVAIIATLLTFFHLYPLKTPDGARVVTSEMLLMGFANPALIAVVSLLVIGQAVIRTGALNEVSGLILKLSRNRGKLAIGLSLLIVLLVSGFLNNTPVVVIFIPIIGMLAKRLNISASAVMMPVSFAAIAGGMTTLIGSSTNLLVSGALHDLGVAELHFFDFVVPGAIIAGSVFFYIFLVVPRILPDRAGMAEELMGGKDGKQFVAQLTIEANSDLIGKSLASGKLEGYPDLTVRMVQRMEHAFLPPFDDDLAIRTGDTLIVAAPREAISALIKKEPDSLLQKFFEIYGQAEDEGEKPEATLAEVIVAPASRMVGLTLEQIGFRYNYHCMVLGIQRKSRVIRTKLTEIRLAAGDVLLVLGAPKNILNLRSNNDVMLMEWSKEDLPTRNTAHRALAIFFGIVALAAFEIIPIHITAMAGVALVILTNCLNIRQAIRAVDSQIIMMVAAALAMSTALQYTGGAAFIANGLVGLLHGASPLVVMSGLFLLMAAATNVLSNNATAVLFTPIAVNTAQALGVDPMMFVFAVIFASNCSFATPIGYQTNLLVMGPGHYKFSDFVRAGVPMVFIVWAAYTGYAWWMFGQ